MMLQIIKAQLCLYILLLVAIIISTIWIYKFKDRLKIQNKKLFLIYIIAGLVLAFLSAGLLAVIEGLSFTGKRIFGPVFFCSIHFLLGAKLFKTNKNEMYDICSIAMIFSMMLIRLDCFRTNCCYGIKIFNNFRVPIRELEILLDIIFLIVFIKKILKKKNNGEVFPLYLIIYGVYRFIAEFFRVEFTPLFRGINTFHYAHLFALISIVIGLFMIIIKKRQNT